VGAADRSKNASDGDDDDDGDVVVAFDEERDLMMESNMDRALVLEARAR